MSGSGEHACVLLHGITASGDIFGAGWDELGRDGRVAIPDILGFSRSMDETASDFSLEAHLDALEQMLVDLALDDALLTLVGHSLGGLVALHWVARRPRVEACAWMCRHRATASWLMVALEPQWPLAIARYGVRHTWPSYLGAMNGVIRRGGWEAPLADLDARQVPVVLAEGTRDPMPVPGRAANLARKHANVRVFTHPTADHELPITDPAWSLDVVRS